jgi:hypothetical protein
MSVGTSPVLPMVGVWPSRLDQASPPRSCCVTRWLRSPASRPSCRVLEPSRLRSWLRWPPRAEPIMQRRPMWFRLSELIRLCLAGGVEPLESFRDEDHDRIRWSSVVLLLEQVVPAELTASCPLELRRSLASI